MPQIRKFVIEDSQGNELYTGSKPRDVRSWFRRQNLASGTYYLRRKITEINFVKRTQQNNSNSNWKDKTLTV